MSNPQQTITVAATSTSRVPATLAPAAAAAAVDLPVSNISPHHDVPLGLWGSGAAASKTRTIVGYSETTLESGSGIKRLPMTAVPCEGSVGLKVTLKNSNGAALEWQQRYLLLDPAAESLTFLRARPGQRRSQNSPISEMQLHLGEVLGVSLWTGDDKTRFDIQLASNVVSLKADNSEDAQRWSNAITLAIRSYRLMTTRPPSAAARCTAIVSSQISSRAAASCSVSVASSERSF